MTKTQNPKYDLEERTLEYGKRIIRLASPVQASPVQACLPVGGLRA